MQVNKDISMPVCMQLNKRRDFKFSRKLSEHYWGNILQAKTFLCTHRSKNTQWMQILTKKNTINVSFT